MASYRLPKLARYIPLWQREIPPYPLYWKGNPQLRVFMPLFWMKMINSDKKAPPGIIRFEVHRQMTKYDVKNYLEKIYKVPVLSVKMATSAGEEVKHPRGFILRKELDKKWAIVRLDGGETFDFPELFPDTKKTEDEKSAKEFKTAVKEQEKMFQKTWDKRDLPTWFR